MFTTMVSFLPSSTLIWCNCCSCWPTQHHNLKNLEFVLCVETTCAKKKKEKRKAISLVSWLSCGRKRNGLSYQTRWSMEYDIKRTAQLMNMAVWEVQRQLLLLSWINNSGKVLDVKQIYSVITFTTKTYIINRQSPATSSLTTGMCDVGRQSGYRSLRLSV